MNVEWLPVAYTGLAALALAGWSLLALLVAAEVHYQRKRIAEARKRLAQLVRVS